MRSKLAIVVAVVLLSGCSDRAETLKVDGRTVVVLNDTKESWKGIEVWVNDHYRVTKDEMLPGERFTAPLDMFVAGFGQRFPQNQSVGNIKVTATDASGDHVQLAWGIKRGN